MSSSTGNETGKSEGLVPAGHRPPAVRREGAITIGATAVGALALGALAIGALAIGKRSDSLFLAGLRCVGCTLTT
jgi:hypothetical protein